MIFNFRQGIISGNTNLNYDGTNVSITAQMLLNFSHGNVNYFYTSLPITAAWANLPSTCWLYWDIDLITSVISYNYTLVEPSFGVSFPESPPVDQHFFNIAYNKMYVWSGQFWVEVIRLFAGNVLSNILGFETVSSQVGQNYQCISGNILLDFNFNPIVVFDQDGTYHFLTDASISNFPHTNKSNFTFQGVKLNAFAEENISIYKCVRWDSANNIIAASYMDQVPAIAIITQNAVTGNIIKLTTSGHLKNQAWGWTYPPHTPLFVGLNGELTVSVPQSGSIQYVGYIVDSRTIFINFDKQILINPPSVTPTPTLTPTMTASGI